MSMIASDFSSLDCVAGNCLIRNLCVRESGQFLYFQGWTDDLSHVC